MADHDGHNWWQCPDFGRMCHADTRKERAAAARDVQEAHLPRRELVYSGPSTTLQAGERVLSRRDCERLNHRG